MRAGLLAAAAVGTLAVASLAPAAAGVPGASTASGASVGTYLVPFREDHAVFTPQAGGAGSFSQGNYAGQPTDANGCVANGLKNAPAGNPDAYNCLPVGASVVQLADGRILYWDALEGTENLAFGSLNSTVPDGGRLTVNDESRLLTLGPDGPSWAIPNHEDGGAHNASTNEDLPLPQPIAATHYSYNDGSLFCSDQVLLSDGSVLDVGGTDYYSEPSVPGTGKGVVELEGIRNSRIFEPDLATGAGWVQAAPMNYGRWYPALVTLGDGEVFVASGVTKLLKPVYVPATGQNSQTADSGTNVKQTETYNPYIPGGGTWTANGANAERSLPLFPRLHLLPNGHVYYDAAGQDFNPAGQSYDEALWGVAATYDPVSKSWNDLGIPGLGSPGVNPVYAGFRGSTFSAALQLRPDAGGAYTRASFLTAGGVLLPSPGSYVAVADSRIDTVSTDASGHNEQLATTPTGPLGRNRWYSAAVPLPDGTVYTVDGADIDEVVTPGLESPILTAELFTPTIDAKGNYTGGSWQDAGTVGRKRTYHNTAILLADGSVLIGGHAPIPSMYNQTLDGPDLPGRPGTNNHHDGSFQIYRPPYFNESRPTVDGVTQSGRDIIVSTPEAAKIASVVLIRSSAQTHLVDGDARTVQLPIDGRGDGFVVARLPASSDVLPNGPYLLFANEGKNGPNDVAPGHVIPSVGRMLFVEGTRVPSIVVPDVAVHAASTGGQPAGSASGAAAVAGPAGAAVAHAGTGVRLSDLLADRPGQLASARLSPRSGGAPPALVGLGLLGLLGAAAAAASAGVRRLKGRSATPTIARDG